MANGKKELWELRNGFYSCVTEIIAESSREVRELRQVDDTPYRQKKGKFIGIVDGMEQAVKVKGEILALQTRTNEKMRLAASSAGLPVTPIALKVEIIKPEGDVALTEGAAQRRISAKGKVIRQEIKAYIDYLKAQENPDFTEISIAEELYKNISTEELYISATDSGSSYRVSYYSGFDRSRKQQSVGDILLIAGDSDTQLVQAPQRKRRADRSVQLGVYYKQIANSNQMALHRVYEFDKRYIKRRENRLQDV